jgi:hypothetical protein
MATLILLLDFDGMLHHENVSIKRVHSGTALYCVHVRDIQLAPQFHIVGATLVFGSLHNLAALDGLAYHGWACGGCSLLATW